jgi:hypothetical protein
LTLLAYSIIIVHSNPMAIGHRCIKQNLTLTLNITLKHSVMVASMAAEATLPTVVAVAIGRERGDGAQAWQWHTSSIGAAVTAHELGGGSVGL